MSLPAGSTVGPYEILDKLGEGAMGVVYRGRDARLSREVAIKILSAAFGSDPERLARFGREARTLASLNHPNIAQIHGVEESGAGPALVMELVSGEDLAVRLGQGPMPLAEALPIARQIAHALEAAHDQGIVHRDLKPANIKVRGDGTVKVLDFGLAKGPDAGAAGGGQHVELSHSPTLTRPAATALGVVLGTAAYMSPEQAKGRPVDARADIWAFGVVLFEMLTGGRAFAGDDVSETMAAILRDEPDWARLPAELPATMRVFLQRCLHKDPGQRLRHIGDMRLALEGAFETAPVAGRGPSSRRRIARWAAGAAAGAAVIAVAAFLGLRYRDAEPFPQQVRRFPLTLPQPDRIPGGIGTVLSLSPDGQTLVYMAQVDDLFRLLRRDLGGLEDILVAGSENTSADPFFSDDGRWIGFHAGRSLMKVSVGGGPPERVAMLPESNPRGATWAPDGTILLGMRGSGLVRVPSDGGEPAILAKPDDDREHWYPQVLPEGRAVLFTAIRPPADGELRVMDLESRTTRTVLRNANAGHYLPTGHLVFERGGDLWAVRFDATRLEARGDPVIVERGVRVETGGAVQAAFAADGSMAYVPSGAATARLSLVWVNRRGAEEPLALEPRAFESPRLSPDGRRLAVALRGSDSDIWIYDLALGSLSRLTFDAAEDESPLWSPDGRSVAYAATRGTERVTMQRSADGSGNETRLSSGLLHHHLSAWSHDGRTIAFDTRGDDSASWDVSVSAVAADARAAPLFATSLTERGAVFSPDGRWVAYESSETGRSQVYVQAFPGGGGKRQISVDGGSEPLWSPDGREIFFRSGARMMSTAVDAAGGPVSRPRAIFEGEYERLPWGTRNYDVSPDGQRFLMVKARATGEPQRIVLVQNFGAALARLLPR